MKFFCSWLWCGNINIMQETHNVSQSKNGVVGRKPNAGAFKKGHPGGPGRKPGETVGVVRTLREAVELAARDCHPQGLAGWLVERAQGGVQDRQIFANMVGKVIPIQVNQAVSGGVSISLNWLGQRNIGTIAAQPKVIDAQTIDLIEHSDERRWITDGAQGAAQPEPVGAAQQGLGHQGSQAPVNAAPRPVKTLSRGAGTDPPPPVDPDMGG